jgi:hypothetical protein
MSYPVGQLRLDASRKLSVELVLRLFRGFDFPHLRQPLEIKGILFLLSRNGPFLLSCYAAVCAEESLLGFSGLSKLRSTKCMQLFDATRAWTRTVRPN